MTNTDTVADVLNRAADLIETYGHCKGNVTDSQGRICAYTAINMGREDAGQGNDVDNAACFRLRARVEPLTILDWNDAPERTAEEVVATLRAAAEDVVSDA